MQIEKEAPEIIVKISGKIDAVNADDIQKEALELIQSGGEVDSFTFNVEDVTFVSSAGLRMFSAVAKVCKEEEIDYALDGLRKDIVRMFQLTGYSSAFTIRQKVEV